MSQRKRKPRAGKRLSPRAARRGFSSRGLLTALAALVLVPMAVWSVLKANEGENAQVPEAGQVKTGLPASDILGGEDRYLSYLSTDKQIYKPGEKIYCRAVLLHSQNRQPISAEMGQQSPATIEIKGPKGDTVAGGEAQCEDGVYGYSWAIPEGQAGGEYTMKITFAWSGYAPAERKFDVRNYRAPRLKSQIKFLRDGYGPGDEVAATLEVSRAEGGIPAGAPVTVIARVDGDEVYRGSSSVDEKGNCLARFQLPAEIRRGEGTLALVIEDGGVVETASKTIPILLQTVDLTMYAEGGELVAGLPNRVYFEAFTPAKKPADLAGVVVDNEGNEVAEFRSAHEGRGRFAFTPAAGKSYELRIQEPSGINTRYPLPEVKAEGVRIGGTADVTPRGKPVVVEVGSAADRAVGVTLSKREQVVAERQVELKAGAVQTIAFEAPKADGVLIATVWDSEGKPLAERLVYIEPAKSVSIKLTPDSKKYLPGGKAKIDILTTDENGNPVSAVVGVTVSDESVFEMTERREQSPNLPVMVLLEGEVDELADAHVYFDKENEEAPLAVDLLLGTQGWRRFAFVDSAKFIGEHGDNARRVLALKMQTQREMRRSMAMRGDRADFDGRAIPRVAQAFAAPAGAAPDAVEAEAAIEDDAAAPEELAAEGPPAIDEAPVDLANAAQAADDIPAAPAEPFAGADGDRQIAGQQGQEGEGAPVVAEEQNELQKQLELAQGKREAADLILGDRIEGRGRGAARMRDLPPQRANDMVAVRVYAHEVRNDRQPGVRTDFTETLCWHAGLKTDDAGKASIEFGLNDSVTSFRVAADAFTASGALGSAALAIESVEPFYLEPKLPLEVTMGDVLRIPLGVVNSTPGALDAEVRVESHASQNVDQTAALLNLPADSRLRKLLTINVGKYHGKADLTLSAQAGSYSDRVTRSFIVKPLGFPQSQGYGGLIGPGDTVTHTFIVPQDMVKGSMQGRAVVYPTPLASMNEALASLIREPYGCFEQTSSTSYPLVMAQQYFKSHEGVDPQTIERSSQILQTSYERLIGFESPGHGYEWFGADPGHDALTAYGLLQFTDMAQVRHVDSEMLNRTRAWLLAQRDGKGGFSRRTHTLHTWLPDPEVSTAYNVWALLAAGIDADLTKEVEWVREAAERSENTYVLALAANVMALAKNEEGRARMLDKLAGLQEENGSLKGATVSVVGSGGEALEIETTALAVLAWLNDPAYTSQVESGIKYLAEQCKAGRFSSTQATVLALKAIVEYDKSRAKPKAPGSLQLVLNGKPVGEPVSFTAETTGAIELPDLSELLAPGENKLQLTMTDGSQMPYSMAVEFFCLTPAASEACKLHLDVTLRDDKIDEGAITEMQIAVVNRTGDKLPNPVAIIGIPGGLEVRHDQLKELVKAGRIAAYEVLGREVVLYWRTLDAEERIELPISLVAAIPGTYTGPASRAYEYYTDEHKHWVEGKKVDIEAINR